MDMRYVCPKDVRNMLSRQARVSQLEEGVAKHEYEELKEELALALLRKKTKEEWTENIEMLREKHFW